MTVNGYPITGYRKYPGARDEAFARMEELNAISSEVKKGFAQLAQWTDRGMA